MNTIYCQQVFSDGPGWIGFSSLMLLVIFGLALICHRLGNFLERFDHMDRRVSHLEGLADTILSRLQVMEARLYLIEDRVERLASDFEPTVRAFPVLVHKMTELSNTTKKLTNTGHDILQKVQVLWRSGLVESHPAIALSAHGHRLLVQLGRDFVTPSMYKEVIGAVRILHPENRLQVQQHVIDVVAGFADRIEYRDYLEEIAYQAGCTVDMLLFTVAISICDKVMDDLRFTKKFLPSTT